MTANEIIELLESKLFLKNDMYPEVWMYADNYINIEEVEKYSNDKEFVEAFRRLGEFKCVAKFGGEGDGDDYWKVFHFKTHNVYLKFYGWYASHSGANYQDVCEVKPVEVMKIEWSPVE